jgi:gamma-glutamylcyclotransferase (GGCT)/AIG2-like uncharacterized protein YtfP
VPDSIAPHATLNANRPEGECHLSEYTNSHMLIFSYGAGMLSSVIRQRCTDAEFYATAALVDHELCFCRWDKSKSSYVAGLRRCPGQMLWGVLWRIPQAQIHKLDELEGYCPDRPVNNGYERIPVVVHSPKGDPISAETYEPVEPERDGRPTRSYRDSLLAGAMENSLPRPYVNYLKQ